MLVFFFVLVVRRDVTHADTVPDSAVSAYSLCLNIENHLSSRKAAAKADQVLAMNNCYRSMNQPVLAGVIPAPKGVRVSIST